MIGLPSIRTHRLTQKLMSHFVSEAKAPQGKHMSKRQAPEVSQVSTRDADDATVTTSPSAAPLADMTQRPCDFPLAPILAHQHTPYEAHHYCGCLTASVDTVGMSQTCDETLAAITPMSTRKTTSQMTTYHTSGMTPSRMRWKHQYLPHWRSM